jgi:hypothetical protein
MTEGFSQVIENRLLSDLDVWNSSTAAKILKRFLLRSWAESSNRLLEGNYVRWWRRRPDLPKANSVLFPKGLVIMLEKHCWPAMAKCQA